MDANQPEEQHNQTKYAYPCSESNRTTLSSERRQGGKKRNTTSRYKDTNEYIGTIFCIQALWGLKNKNNVKWDQNLVNAIFEK